MKSLAHMEKISLRQNYLSMSPLEFNKYPQSAELGPRNREHKNHQRQNLENPPKGQNPNFQNFIT